MLLVGFLTSSLFWLRSAIKSEELACFVRPWYMGRSQKNHQPCASRVTSLGDN